MTLRKLTSILLLAVLPFCSTGCWDRRELEDLAFVQSIGIDKANGNSNQLLVTFTIGIPSKSGLGQTGGGGGGGEGSIARQASLLTTVEAPSIPIAISMAQGYINREINLLHVKGVVFGEAFARSGVESVLNMLTRYRQLRRNIFVCVSKGYAYEFLKNNEPDLEKSFTKWWEGVKLMESAIATHPGSLLHEFVTDVERMDKDATMIYIALNKNSKEGEPKDIKALPSYKEGLGVKAGEIPRKGGNPAEFMGTAIFKRDKLEDVLNLTETRSLQMVTGDFKKTIYAVADPAAPQQYVNIEIKQGSPPKIRTSLKGEKILIEEEIFLEGDLISMQSKADYMSSASGVMKLNKIVQHDIEQRTLDLNKKFQGKGIDIAGFGSYVKRHFLTNSQWEKFDWSEKIKEADINIKVNFNLRRTGMQTEQPEPILY